MAIQATENNIMSAVSCCQSNLTGRMEGVLGGGSRRPLGFCNGVAWNPSSNLGSESYKMLSAAVGNYMLAFWSFCFKPPNIGVSIQAVRRVVLESQIATNDYLY